MLSSVRRAGPEFERDKGPYSDEPVIEDMVDTRKEISNNIFCTSSTDTREGTMVVRGNRVPADQISIHEKMKK